MSKINVKPQTGAAGTFRLNAPLLLEMAKVNGVENAHQLHLKSGIPWVTLHRYLSDAPLTSVNFSILAALFFDGVGLVPVELDEIHFSELFIYTPNNQ